MTNRPDEDKSISPQDTLSIWYLIDGTIPEDPVREWFHGKVRYLTHAEEHEGRKLLAGLLRSRKRGPDPTMEERERVFNEVCHRLADLIDPDGDPEGYCLRKIVFKNRKRGALLQRDVQWKIIDDVREARKRQPNDEEAIAEAATENGVSDSRVRQLWYGRPGALHRRPRHDRTPP